MAQENDSTDKNADNDASTSGSKRKRWLIAVAVVVVVLLVAYGFYWFLYAQYYVSTDDAYVHGNIVSVSPRVPGTVIAVFAHNTDLVHAGDALVQLDPTDAKLALGRAKAHLAGTVRKVRRMFDQAGQMQATVALRKASLEQAHRDYQRAQKLKKIRGISTEDFQHAQTALHVARASYRQAQKQLDAARAAIAGTTIADHPQVKLAKAALRAAWLALQRTHVVAPVTGYVAQRDVQLGERVGPKSKLMAVIPLDQIWVAANFKETSLANVRIGQPVTLTADFYGDYSYHGTVVGLAAGTGSAFSLLPAQNATGNWIKVVQRLPVRIAIDPDDLQGHPLRIGLSMSVTIDIRDHSGKMLAAKTATGSSETTGVYRSGTTEVDALIQHIVAANSGKN